MKTTIPVLIVLGILAWVFIANSTYTVSEVEQVIITQFGRPVGIAA